MRTAGAGGEDNVTGTVPAPPPDGADTNAPGNATTGTGAASAGTVPAAAGSRRDRSRGAATAGSPGSRT